MNYSGDNSGREDSYPKIPALEELQEKNIFDIFSEHILYQDLTHTILWANKSACDSVGLSRDDVLGKHCYAVWAGRETPCIGCPVEKALKTNTPQEGEMCTPDGRMWYIKGYPLHDKDSNCVGAIEITVDITRLKKTQERLKKQKEELSAFSHTVAHNLKNYMSIIRICTQFLLLKGEYIEKHVQRIDTAIGKMDRFLSQLLRLADAGRVIWMSMRVDLGRLIDEMERAHEITIYKNELPTVMGDPIRLEEIFNSLIDNAIVHGEASRIQISSEKKEKSYLISLRDNGKGIPREDLDHIFEMEYSHTGTGFGLTIVKKIIEAHGGSISVSSTVGKGTIVTLEFPREGIIRANR
jgi:PAS domain S-box-containing protein